MHSSGFHANGYSVTPDYSATGYGYNQGYANQGYANQGYANQGYANQGYTGGVSTNASTNANLGNAPVGQPIPNGSSVTGSAQVTGQQ